MPWRAPCAAGTTIVLIFLPGALLTLAALHFWARWNHLAWLRGALSAVSAAVIGLLVAALWDPILTHGVTGWATGLIAVAAGAALFVKAPPWSVAVGAALAGDRVLTPARLLEKFVAGVVETLDASARRFSDALDAIEDRVLDETLSCDPAALAPIRRQAVRLQRQLAGLRAVFHRLEDETEDEDDAPVLAFNPPRRPIVPAGQPLPPQPSANEISPEALASVREVEKKARKLTLMELTERTCKWPIGDPATDKFWFCGLPSQPGKPYCEAHVGVAFQPMSARRDRRR